MQARQVAQDGRRDGKRQVPTVFVDETLRGAQIANQHYLYHVDDEDDLICHRRRS